ncbi:hypothetical protein A2U01_0042860, partial [Trifolium medium]|nr:hypothetical protein [Trifolium medium]
MIWRSKRILEFARYSGKECLARAWCGVTEKAFSMGGRFSTSIGRFASNCQLDNKGRFVVLVVGSS